MSLDDGFGKVENSYNKSAYYSICDDVNEIWKNGYLFYMENIFVVFSDARKATKRFLSGNLRQLIITQSKHFTRKCIER